MTFTDERWDAIAPELGPLIQEHWGETDVYQHAVPLDLNAELYRERDALGQLHVTAARLDGRLVGYFLFFLVPDPHHRSTLFAFMDSCFLLRECRQATNALQLFAFTERRLREKGALVAVAQTSAAIDLSPIFGRFGWQKGGASFTKLLIP